MSDRVDPRVLRTKANLHQALRDLMITHRWEKIRVQDILEKTGISRSAFYSHYESKYDLLISAVPELNVFLGDANTGVDLTPLFLHVDDVADIMRPLLSQPVAGEILQDFHRSLAQKWLGFLADTPHAGDRTLADLLAGAVLAAAQQFLRERNRQDPRDTAAVVNEHLQRMIAS